MKQEYGMSKGMDKSVKDYQPSSSEFAGKMMGKANDYMSRTERTMNKAASKVKSQAHVGRYD